MRFFIFIILAVTLLAGCNGPADKTVYLNPGDAVPSGLIEMRMPTCCGSMKPAIMGGERTWVERYSNQTGLSGYIVMTDKVTHRVVAETQDTVVLAGDNNASADGRVLKSDIRYIVKYIMRHEAK